MEGANAAAADVTKEKEGVRASPPLPSPSPSSLAMLRELMDVDLDLLDSSWHVDSEGSPQSGFSLPSPIFPWLGNNFPAASRSTPVCLPDDKRTAYDGQQEGELPSGNCSKVKVQPVCATRKRPIMSAPLEEYYDSSCAFKERMTQALRYFKDSTDQNVLVQVWAPVKRGDKYVLTTSGQPFVLDPHSTGLLQYRTVSLMYVFSVDGEGGELGLPGRVFRQKLPEWSPNVQYYSCNEYPRLNHALSYNVRGTLALPVFEQTGQSCIGVLELILTSPKINYAPEVDKVCKALEAVNLKSSEIVDSPSLQICNEARQAALAEILEVLSVVCEAHKLPLAQTWVPCMHRSVLANGGGSRKSCTSFDGSCKEQICMSTTDVAFYVVDAHVWGFRDACSEHHLLKGQGVVGRAFASGKPCFSRNVTRFSKNEYPLVHYARMFGLGGCFAICVQSNHTGSDNYILEFFLPPSCDETRLQDILLDDIPSNIRQCFRSLKVVNGNELQDITSFEIAEKVAEQKQDSESGDLRNPHNATESVEAAQLSDVPQTIENIRTRDVPKPSQLQESGKESDALKTDMELVNDAISKGKPSSSIEIINVKSERRRGKPEKAIKLEVLQQYFSGSLKDAAKSLGVCPTTMKRICRQYGISRWPSRKINKVNRSLSKIKEVIESVQGADGVYKLGSFTNDAVPAAVTSRFWLLNVDPTQQLSVGISSMVQEASDNYNQDLKTCERVIFSDPLGLVNGVDMVSTPNKPSVSGAGSTEIHASQNSSQGNPTSETHLNNQDPLDGLLHCQNIYDPNSTFNLLEVSNINVASLSNIVGTDNSDPFVGTKPIKDSGSSKDLTVEACQVPEDLPNSSLRNTWMATIKATYKEDIIRFKLPSDAEICTLREEVAKRLRLEIGTFDIKYLDDDQEWVVLACDLDLEDCIENSRQTGGQTIRLSIHDVLSHLGSSCESTGDVL